MADSQAVERARKRGRRIAWVLFAAIVIGIVLTWTVQIIQQVFFRPPTAATMECRPGVLGLITAVRRARQAADAEIGGERAAVARFREALDPEWSGRDALTAACQSDPLGQRALREVDRLRYAEEHATRYEAVDLAPRRRGIAKLERELGR
jgi:hypothetical protein